MKYNFAAALLIVSTGAAFAQTTPPANHDAGTPAVSRSTTTNPGAPVAGANSFTEGQAKSRMEKEGYTDVTRLMKDKDGVWHADASKAGKSYKVSLDFQGNITAN
jgi:hypothetical protein